VTANDVLQLVDQARIGITAEMKAAKARLRQAKARLRAARAA